MSTAQIASTAQAKNTAQVSARKEARSQDPRTGVRKVTYSLPAHLVSELDRRAAEAAMPKSTLVAEALALYFAEKDREALAQIYLEAARDPLFEADNEEVLRDFAALDAEADSETT